VLRTWLNEATAAVISGTETEDWMCRVLEARTLTGEMYDDVVLD
jgi:hypothetical protein